MPSFSTTSFFSSRCATITSDPRSSWRPATFWMIAWPWWTTNLRSSSGIRTQAFAPTGRRLAHVTAAPAEPEEAALDRVEEHRTVDLLDGREGEGGVALELREPEVRPECRDDGADEVGEDVLGVVQLHAAQVAGVPGDVGDQEARGVRGRGGHGSFGGAGCATSATIRPGVPGPGSAPPLPGGMGGHASVDHQVVTRDPRRHRRRGEETRVRIAHPRATANQRRRCTPAADTGG